MSQANGENDPSLIGGQSLVRNSDEIAWGDSHLRRQKLWWVNVSSLRLVSLPFLAMLRYQGQTQESYPRKSWDTAKAQRRGSAVAPSYIYIYLCSGEFHTRSIPPDIDMNEVRNILLTKGRAYERVPPE